MKVSSFKFQVTRRDFVHMPSERGLSRAEVHITANRGLWAVVWRVLIPRLATFNLKLATQKYWKYNPINTHAPAQ